MINRVTWNQIKDSREKITRYLVKVCIESCSLEISWEQIDVSKSANGGRSPRVQQFLFIKVLIRLAGCCTQQLASLRLFR